MAQAVKTGLSPLPVNLPSSAAGGLGSQLIGGHYRAYPSVTALAPAANANLAAFRWTASTFVCIPLRICVAVTVASAVTAQRQDPIALFIARGYSVADSTNSATVTLSGNNAKARTTPFGATVLSSFGLANAAAGVSGGNKTVDANPFGLAPLDAALLGVGTQTRLIDLYRADVVNHEYPLVLQANEGFLVQWGATALATGTVVVTIGVEWAEAVKY